jgi:hypothetical protein
MLGEALVDALKSKPNPNHDLAYNLHNQALSDWQRGYEQNMENCAHDKERLTQAANLAVRRLEKAVKLWPEERTIRADLAIFYGIQIGADECLKFTIQNIPPRLKYMRMAANLTGREGFFKEIAKIERELVSLKKERPCSACSEKLLAGLATAARSSGLARQYAGEALTAWDTCSRNNICKASALVQQAEACLRQFPTPDEAGNSGMAQCINYAVDHH